MTQHLAHYGVKGMKWGKRKAQLPSQRMMEAIRNNPEYGSKEDWAEADKVRANRKIRVEHYKKKGREYVGHALKRLKVGDLKTAYQHLKTAKDYSDKADFSYKRPFGTRGTEAGRVERAPEGDRWTWYDGTSSFIRKK